MCFLSASHQSLHWYIRKKKLLLMDQDKIYLINFYIAMKYSHFLVKQLII